MTIDPSGTPDSCQPPEVFATGLAHRLEVATRNLQEYIAARANEAAMPAIADAERRIEETIKACDYQLERKDDLIAELRRQLEFALKRCAALDEYVTRQRAESWKPIGRDPVPLTASQRESLRRNECRTDWPAYVPSCDPAMRLVPADSHPDQPYSYMVVECSADGEEICGICDDQPWSEVVAQVAAHRCGSVQAVEAAR